MNNDFLIHLGEQTTIKLCDIVITNRYLGMLKTESYFSMLELARRRNCGDDFDFEHYIETEISKLPKYDLNTQLSPDIRGFFNKIML